MSLINDALKRANEIRPPPAGEGNAAPLMRVVAASPRPVIWAVVLVPLGLMVVFCAALWFLWRGWELSRQQPAQQAPIPIVAREPLPQLAPAESTPQSPASLPRSEPPIAPAAVSPVAAAPGEMASVTADSASAATEAVATPSTPPPPTPAPLKLQGIFFQPRNSAAIINTKTYFIGDTVDTSTIVAIDQRSVTLVQAGQTNILTLR